VHLANACTADNLANGDKSGMFTHLQLWACWLLLLGPACLHNNSMHDGAG
jgi:hypothetical protein